MTQTRNRTRMIHSTHHFHNDIKIIPPAYGKSMHVILLSKCSDFIGVVIECYRTSSIFNGHDAHDSSSISKSRYSNDAAESSSHSTNALNASTDGSSTNGDNDDDLSSPYSSTNFTKRLLSLRNRSLGATHNAPTMLDASKCNSFSPFFSFRSASHSFRFVFRQGNRYDRYSTAPMLNYPSARVSRYLNDSASARLSMLSRDNSIVYQANLHSSNRKPFSIRSFFGDFFNRQYERYCGKQSLVPCILLSALFLFFASVIIAYLTMNPDLSLALDAKAATFKLCPDTETMHVNGEPHFKSTVNCIEKDELDAAFNVLKLLIPQLQQRIEHNRCNDATAPFAMSALEAVKFLIEQQDQTPIDLRRALHNAEYLISVNPQWRVGHFIDSSGHAASSISMAGIVKQRSSQSNFYAIVKPRLPISCFLYNKLQAVFAIIGWIVVIALVACVILFGIRFVRGHLQTRRERVTNMVEEIKNVLMEKAYDPDTACTDAASIVINHLRDKLIAPTERSKMESVWNAAIKAIESDSRVQFR